MCLVHCHQRQVASAVHGLKQVYKPASARYAFKGGPLLGGKTQVPPMHARETRQPGGGLDGKEGPMRGPGGLAW